MLVRSFYLCVLVSSLPIIGVLSQATDTGCISPDSLLEGRRRIVSATFRARNARSGNPASQAKLDDGGWCSGRLAANIFDPYIEVDFGRDVLFTSVATQGVESLFIQRYRVEVAGEDGHLQYITPSNNSQSQPAIFPLGQSRISNANRHTESLPRPVIGQLLRISPYEWNNNDYACNKLEVYGCPLQECQSESQLNSNQYVDDVTVSDSSIDHSYLFNFYDTERYYCGPSDVGRFNITITYSSPVLLTEIGIHGRDRTFPRSDQFVTSFSLSFSEDGDNFTEYIRDTGSTEFTVPDQRQYFFGLWPPITASSIKITINDWNGQPCMSLLMLGCNYSDVVNHSNEIVNGTDSGLVAEVTLTTTEFMTTTTELVIVTATVTQTSMITVTADLNCTPSPSPAQSSGAGGSASSDTDNTPIYVAVAIVIVGLLIIITANIVGVILCRRYWQEKQSDGSLTIKYNNENRTEPLLVDAKRYLHAGEGLDEKLKSESGKDVKSKQVVSTSVPASAHKNQRFETENLQYESVGDPRHMITDDYVISSLTQDEITTKNDPAIVDNPAYSTSGAPPLVDNPAYSTNRAPPLVDNPAYIAMKGGPGTTTHSNN